MQGRTVCGVVGMALVGEVQQHIVPQEQGFPALHQVHHILAVKLEGAQQRLEAALGAMGVEGASGVRCAAIWGEEEHGDGGHVAKANVSCRVVRRWARVWWGVQDAIRA